MSFVRLARTVYAPREGVKKYTPPGERIPIVEPAVRVTPVPDEDFLIYSVEVGLILGAAPKRMGRSRKQTPEGGFPESADATLSQQTRHLRRGMERG